MCIAGKTAGVLKLFSLAVGVGAPAASFFSKRRGFRRSVENSSACHPAPRAFDELDQIRYLRGVRGMGGLEGAERIGKIPVLFEEQFFVSTLECTNVLFGKSPALKAHQVQAAGGGGVAIHNHERRHVLHDLRQAADDRVFADPAELVDCGKTGDDRVVLDGDVAGQAHGIRKDDVIAKLAVMGDVRVAEQQIVRTDSRRQTLMGPAMYRGVFPKYIEITYLKGGRFADIFEVLGFAANHGEGEELIAAPEFRVPFQHHVGVQNTIVAQFDVRPHHAKGADPDMVPNFGLRRNDSGWMDHGRNFVGTMGA